jgi:hypothetical protein
MQSVQQYADQHQFEYKVLTSPRLRIRPDIFSTNRSEESYQKHGGFLPIYEKENAFDMLDQYDNIVIIDADIYIRPDAPNILEAFDSSKAFGAVIERDMPITDEYKRKIINYSRMQYQPLVGKIDCKPNPLGYEFHNMGMIVLNCKQFKPFLKGQTAKQFIERMEFKDFVDGKGPWKWSTDQTLLNYFIRKYDVPTDNMSWKWNGLYAANTKIDECHFIHFFLKDKLPNRGENVEQLMEHVK